MFRRGLLTIIALALGTFALANDVWEEFYDNPQEGFYSLCVNDNSQNVELDDNPSDCFRVEIVTNYDQQCKASESCQLGTALFFNIENSVNSTLVGGKGVGSGFATDSNITATRTASETFSTNTPFDAASLSGGRSRGELYAFLDHDAQGGANDVDIGFLTLRYTCFDPSPTVVATNYDPATDTATVDVVFRANGTGTSTAGLTVNDLTLGGASPANSGLTNLRQSGDGTMYSIDVQYPSAGTYSLSLDASNMSKTGCFGVANNRSPGQLQSVQTGGVNGGTLAFTIPDLSPQITTFQADTSDADYNGTAFEGSFPVNLTFDRTVTGLTVDDFEFTQGTETGASVATATLTQIDGSNYRLDVTPIKEGTLDIALKADAAQRVRGNGQVDTTANSPADNVTVQTANLAPSVSGVSFLSSGVYGVGDVVRVVVGFSEGFDLVGGGVPSLGLSVGGDVVGMDFVGVSGSGDGLVFEWVVSGGFDGGVGVVGDSLGLGGGSLVGVETGAEGVLGFGGVSGGVGQVVDTTRPVVDSVGLPSGGTYLVSGVNAADNRLDFVVGVSEDVVVEGVPGLPVVVGGVSGVAEFVSGESSASSLVFRYEVGLGDSGGVVLGSEVRLLGGSVVDGAGNALELGLPGGVPGVVDGVVVDGLAPVVEGVSVPADGFYGVSEVLSFGVVLSESVSVVGDVGDVVLGVDLGGGVVLDAGLVASSVPAGGSSRELEFEVVVPSGVVGVGGVGLVWDGLVGGSGYLVDGVGNRVSLVGVPVSSVGGVRVDGVAPVLSGVGGVSGGVSVFENVVSVGVVDAVDDSAVVFEVSGGADQALFEVGEASGVLGFKSAPDFEAPGDVGGNNQYAVEVSVVDAAGNVSVRSVVVTVVDVVDEVAPTVVSFTPSVGEGRRSSLVNVDGLVVVLSEDVQLGSGVVEFRGDDGSVVGVPVGDAGQVSLSDSGGSGSGSDVVSVMPSGVLDGRVGFDVVFPEGVLLDLADSQASGVPANALGEVVLRLEGDGVAPVVEGVSVPSGGGEVVVGFDERLDVGSVPGVGAFVVRAGGVLLEVGGVEVRRVGGVGEVVLSGLDPVVPGGVGVEVAYVRSGSGGVLRDVAGNEVGSFVEVLAGDAAGQGSGVVDGVAPSVVVSEDAPVDVDVPDVFEVRVVFSEPVGGFEVSDVVVVNGVVSGFEGVSRSEFVFDVTPVGNGVVSVEVPDGVAFDVAGNVSVEDGAGSALLSLRREAPVVVSFVPSELDGRRSSVVNLSGFILEFSEAVQVGSGVVSFVPVGGGEVVEVDVGGPGVRVDGSVVTVVPSGVLDGRVGYRVVVDGSAFDDVRAGASFAPPEGGFVLVGDTEGPVVGVGDVGSGGGSGGGVVASSDGSVGVDFGEPMRIDPLPGVGCFEVRVNGVVVDVLGLGFFGNASGTPNALLSLAVETDPPIVEGAVVDVAYDGGACGVPLADAAGNEVASFAFETSGVAGSGVDGVAPEVVSVVVWDEGGGVVLDGDVVTGGLDVEVVFSEPVGGFEGGDVVAGVVNGRVSDFRGSGDAYRFSVVPVSNGVVSVGVPGGVAFDVGLNESVASGVRSFVADGFNPELVSLSPGRGEVGVRVDTDLVVGFDRVVEEGVGEVVVREVGGGVVERVGVGSGRVSGFGSDVVRVDLVDWLRPGVEYVVEVDGGGFVDGDGDAFVGLGGVWSFVTGSGVGAVPDPREDAGVMGLVEGQPEVLFGVAGGLEGVVSSRLRSLRVGGGGVGGGGVSNVSRQGVELVVASAAVQRGLVALGVVDGLMPSGVWFEDGWGVWSDGRVVLGAGGLDVGGLSVGVDRRVGGLSGGVALRVVGGGEDVGGGARFDVSSLGVSLYGSSVWGGGVFGEGSFVEGSVGYAGVGLRSERVHESGVLRGVRSGGVAFGSVSYGVGLDVGGVSVEPYGRLVGEHGVLGGFEEWGSEAALVFGGRSLGGLSVGGGVDVSGVVVRGWGRLVPSLGVEYRLGGRWVSGGVLEYVSLPGVGFGVEGSSGWGGEWLVRGGFDAWSVGGWGVRVGLEGSSGWGGGSGGSGGVSVGFESAF
mgnify:CR=1 FL=1